MQKDKKQQRHAQIADTAYEILEQKGYTGASLLTIAKAANASNETLYRWYGSKVGLFEAMIADNASEIAMKLAEAATSNGNLRATLAEVAPLLLRMVLGKKAVLLNRAAAADSSNELGRAIAKKGRDAIVPVLKEVIAPIATDTDYCAQEMTETFIGLLIGDLQIRRVIGVMPEPDKSFVTKRANDAIEKFILLYPIAG